MATPDSNQTWGTWEELLLACAVHRHGAHSWDSVAAELHKCNSSLRLATPLACRHKFQELQLRFSKCEAVLLDSAVPWLEELRNLRVAELRHDVHRYDLSIVSLQLKVRRLTEEREHGIENATEILDLEEKVQYGGGERKTNGEENRSINESNSTDPKAAGSGSRPEKANMESVRSEAERKGGGGEDKAAAEHSCYGSCHSVAEKLERVEWGGESGESNSDTQSWAGRSKREEGMDQSGCWRRVSLQSQPLVDILEKLRSHKQVCVSERLLNLNTQEMPDYLNLIRQHLDLETLRSRVEEGFYSDCTTNFFRDLLLLLNNALVYSEPKSEEYQTAVELRRLVSQYQVAFQAGSSRSEVLPPKPAADPEPFATNTKLPLPSTACRKRSSLAGKATRTSAPSSQKKRSPQLQSIVVDDIEKHVVDLKHQDESESGEVEVNIRDEKSTSPAPPRIMKTEEGTNSKSCVNPIPVPKNENNPDDKVMNSKKRNFLNRIKRGPPPDKVLEKEETVKGSSMVVAKSSVKSDENSSGKVVQKEGNLRMRVGGRRAKEQGISGKQSSAAGGEAPDRPPVVLGGKRRRGASSAEAEAGSFGRATKRSRK